MNIGPHDQLLPANTQQNAGDVRSDAFDRLGACAAVLDCDGVIVDTNQTWRLFAHLNDGSSAATGVGINYLDVCDRASAAGVVAGAAVAAGLRQILNGESERMDVEYPCPSPTEDRWFLMQASAVPVRDGAGAVVFHVDITARKLLTDRLAVLADHDALTGLPNRRAAVRYLEQQLDFARDTDQALCVLFLDLNEFKAVNDTYGHHVGDELLVKVGMRARRALRHDDHLCRFGGDEYVVICPGLDHQQAVDLADRLRGVMVAPFQKSAISRCGAASPWGLQSATPWRRPTRCFGMPTNRCTSRSAANGRCRHQYPLTPPGPTIPPCAVRRPQVFGLTELRSNGNPVSGLGQLRH
jgi:diguanylate cyclase (GGDEF)-like protein